MADTCYFPPYHYLTGSYGGASLGQVLEADSQHGRRGAEGEFPFGEETAYTDLGRRIRIYKIKGQFPRSTHIEDAAALIAVCERPGGKTLVHPTRGIVHAACKHLLLRDMPEDAAGVTTYEAEFVEANEFSVGLLGAVVGLAIGDLLGAVQTNFADGYDLASVPVYDTGAAISVAAGIVGAISDAFSGAVGLSSDTNVARIHHDLATVAALQDSLATTVTAWQAISNGIAAIDRYGTSPAAKIVAYKEVINAASQSTSGAAGAIKETVYSTARILGATYMAVAANAASASATAREACALYRVTIQVLQEEAAAAQAQCNDDLFMALFQSIADTQKTLLARVYNSPVVVQYNFNGGVFSVVAAHEIYGDARRYAEIEARNPTMPPYHVGPLVTAVRA